MIDLDFEINEQLKVLQCEIFKLIIPSYLIGECWQKLFFESDIYTKSLAKRGEEKTEKEIIFKGSVFVISSTMTDGITNREVVEWTLTCEKFITYMDRILKYLNKITDADLNKIRIIFR